jgi:hypothetical protein
MVFGDCFEHWTHFFCWLVTQHSRLSVCLAHCNLLVDDLPESYMLSPVDSEEQKTTQHHPVPNSPVLCFFPEQSYRHSKINAVGGCVAAIYQLVKTVLVSYTRFI